VRKPQFRARSRAEGIPEAFVLCLAATVGPGQADDVASTVLARAAECAAERRARAGTVVLALDGAVDADCLEALCCLQEGLRTLGMCLRLAIGPGEPGRQPRTVAGNALAVHPTLRSALLATYAARLGPGLVTAQVRAALSAPAEPLQIRARFRDDERHMRPQMVRGY